MESALAHGRKRRWGTLCVLSLCYACLLQAALLLIFWQPSLIGRIRNWVQPQAADEYQKNMLTFQLRADAHLAHAALFFGDSHVQGLCTPCIAGNSANYGIGGDTAVGVLKRLPRYHSVRTARFVFVAVGYSDLKRQSVEEVLGTFDQLLHAIPREVPVVVSGLLPLDHRDTQAGRVSNDAILKMNAGLRSLCTRVRCAYVDSYVRLADASGNLRAPFHIGDGVHLSPAGYRIWMSDIADGIATLRPAGHSGAPAAPRAQ